MFMMLTAALENGIVKIRDRETAWFEEIHAAHLTQRMVKIFQNKNVEDTWTKICARKASQDKTHESEFVAVKEEPKNKRKTTNKK
jgi:hypothetical protein